MSKTADIDFFAPKIDKTVNICLKHLKQQNKQTNKIIKFILFESYIQFILFIYFVTCLKQQF